MCEGVNVCLLEKIVFCEFLQYLLKRNNVFMDILVFTGEHWFLMVPDGVDGVCDDLYWKTFFLWLVMVLIGECR